MELQNGTHLNVFHLYSGKLPISLRSYICWKKDKEWRLPHPKNKNKHDKKCLTLLIERIGKQFITKWRSNKKKKKQDGKSKIILTFTQTYL